MTKIKFYKINEDGKITILHYTLIQFLAQNGYFLMFFEKGGTMLVKIKNNIIREVDESDLIKCIQNYLVSLKLNNVLEKFAVGVGSYINKKKLGLLPKIESFSDKDKSDCGWIYYKNTAVKVMADSIEIIPYKQLDHNIWKSRIRTRNFKKLISKKGQFRDFCFKLSKSSADRFLALQTAIGYLMHRYNNPSLCKAIILNDEKISFDGQANGGTGKSLIAKALKHMVNVVFTEGKNLKIGSWFRNQRIGVDTDISVYDDVGKDFSIETIFSELTSGIVIERKRKDEIHLSAKEAPKYLISSNYIVKGPGGSSDERRRYEFELSDFFVKNQPYKVYGNQFFDEWDKCEWDNFDNFMIECLQVYLKHGLVEASPINLKKHRLINVSSAEFEAFSTKMFTSDTWHDKRKMIGLFHIEYPHLIDITSHTFTKWTIEYAKQNNLSYQSKSSGGIYSFQLKSRKEASDEEE
ncbi:hypothetical protein PK35_15520 [Tamlana nanhaiensis]|uniref:Uncharacterized protein n=1 Tax=Neotamlana nanhaiensis TaxID=1382798 RepID=A0A0D7VXV1_9FLAO|nr:primase-helicase family protein [Tamlana nanhaiensis]KJD31243.1 hypothetical protein PK35_15520 [Tamlana nanhaiensis]